MKKLILTIVAFCLLAITLEAQSKGEKKQMKKEMAEQKYLATKDLINSGSFSFVATQTIPNGGSLIFLNTVPNYTNLEGEQTNIYLPYYGAVRMPNRYSADGGIKFKGTVENYQVEFKDNEQTVSVFFEVQRDNERFEFNFDIYKDGWTTLVVASSRRNPITYNGMTSELDMVLTK